MNNQHMSVWLQDNKWIWSMAGSLFIWLAICFITGTLAVGTLFSNLTLACFLAIAALGQTIVITSGDGAIDLSVPNTLTLSAFVTAYVTGNDGSILLGILAALTTGLVIGLCNGLITTKLRVPPIITTLAVNYIVFSIALSFKKTPMGDANEALRGFVRSFVVGGVSSLLIPTLILALAAAFLLYRTKYGKRLHAIGQGSPQSLLAGVKVDQVRIIAFVLGGLCSSITGLLLCAYSGGAFLDMATNYGLPPIAAAVIGGTLISGGKSSVLGSVFGAVLLTLLTALLILTQFSIGYRYIIQGMVFIAILLAFEARRHKKGGEARG
jgi:ribose transport system permease protein